MTTPTPARPRVSALAKAMFGLQAFLLRRNWMGAMGDQLMVITVTGRKSGKRYSTPIGYLADGEAIYALSQGSQWVANALAAPSVTLEIKGRPVEARAERVDDPAERQRLFALYQAQRASNFKQYFGVPVTAPAAELERALASREFVKFMAIP
jgi:deazaflavin-dependent oxidoreductase (nitroreductase family)